MSERQLASNQDGQSAVEPNSNLGKAMSYFIKHFDELSALCRIPRTPINNNESERALKLIIRGSENSLFYQTAVGANIADVICSILVICHEQGIDAKDYLVAVRQNQLQVRASSEKWLPWNYPKKESTVETERTPADANTA